MDTVRFPLGLATVACLALIAVVPQNIQAGDVEPKNPEFVQPASTPSEGTTATVSVELTGKTRLDLERVMTASRPETVRLSVDGVQPPAPGDSGYIGFRLFVNKTDATTETLSTDLHFAGAVAFATNSDPKGQSFMLDVGPTLTRLNRASKLDLSKPLKVTFVPIRDASSEQIKIVGIPVGTVQVTVPGLSK